MKRIPGLTFYLAAFLSMANLRGASATIANDAELKATLQERVDQAGGNAAIVAGIIDGQGSRVVSCGKLDNGTDAKADGDTLFEIDSITKTFTTLALADMVERGEVKLDDPISKFLPTSVKSPARKGREITLLDLATHTSGLPRMPDNLTIRDPEDPYADYTEKELYEFLSHYELPRDIGAEFEYSNIGMELLGQLLSLKAGTNFEALVSARIWSPLSMNSTHIIVPAELKARFATGHDEAGKRVKDWSAPLPGDGGIHSSANDMLKYLSAKMGLTKTKLSAAMELQQTPRHSADGPWQVGLGWMMGKLYGADIVWHNGGSSGYHSFIGFDRRNRRGVVILASTTLDIDDIGMDVLAGTNAIPATHTAAKIDPATFSQFVGRYQFAPEMELTVRREGEHLFVRLTGQDFLETFPESETNFFLKVVDAQISFVKNSEGAVTDVILHQDGTDQTAKKKSNEAFQFDGYLPPQRNSKAGAGKSVADVLALMAGWTRAHPEFRLHSESVDDEGEKCDNVYLMRGSQWKTQVSVKAPYQLSFVEFSSGTNDYLTYLPLTKTTVRNNHWDRDELNLLRLTDWRTVLSPEKVAHYGFEAELITNAAPYCLQIIKKQAPLLKYEYLVDANGQILRTVFFNKSNVQIEWFKEWDFDPSRVELEFNQVKVKTPASKVDFDEAYQKEILAAMGQDK